MILSSIFDFGKSIVSMFFKKSVSISPIKNECCEIISNNIKWSEKWPAKLSELVLNGVEIIVKFII